MNAEPRKKEKPEPDCLHIAKKRCHLCNEMYCPGENCDQYHVSACRDANRS
jgi:hypothetical protein